MTEYTVRIVLHDIENFNYDVLHDAMKEEALYVNPKSDK